MKGKEKERERKGKVRINFRKKKNEQTTRAGNMAQQYFTCLVCLRSWVQSQYHNTQNTTMKIPSNNGSKNPLTPRVLTKTRVEKGYPQSTDRGAATIWGSATPCHMLRTGKASHLFSVCTCHIQAHVTLPFSVTATHLRLEEPEALPGHRQSKAQTPLHGLSLLQNNIFT